MTNKLSNLILASVVCCNCKKKLRTKFVYINNEYSQEILQADGEIISHTLCTSCAIALYGDPEEQELEAA